MNFNKHLIGLAAAVASSSSLASPLLSEGFDDITTLASRGWVITNNSTAASTGKDVRTPWFQGDALTFTAANGADNSYIGANQLSAIYGGAVSNWLFTPEVALSNGETLNFSLRLLGQGYLDKVEVYYSTAGASSNVGGSTSSIGDFKLLKSFEASDDTGWTNESLTLTGLSAATTGRYAFRYVVDNTLTAGNYIGIDTVSISAVPEPTTALMLLLGLGMVAVSRKKISRKNISSKALRMLAIAGLSAGATVAQAGEVQPAANGLMSFPNTRVEVAAPTSTDDAAAGAGMVAYKDPATGQLVGPSAEQAAQLAAAAVPSASARAGSRLAQAARQAPLTTARGGVGRKLDDSSASFAVVYKDADGKLIPACVPGEDVAAHLAHGSSLTAAKGEQQ